MHTFYKLNCQIQGREGDKQNNVYYSQRLPQGFLVLLYSNQHGNQGVAMAVFLPWQTWTEVSLG